MMPLRLARVERALFLSVAAGTAFAGAAWAEPARHDAATAALSTAAAQAQQQLRQSFTNFQFEDFGPSPIVGPIYQALAGGRIVYYAPSSGHLLFAAAYDSTGINVTALAQDSANRKKVSAIDPAGALAVGPADAPTVIEFTDPECPYCQALDRFWAAKALEGKPVRRLIYFVSGIHRAAAAKAEHILCAPDPAAELATTYQGKAPPDLRTCAAGAAKVASDAALAKRVGITGTPTLIVDGQIVSGFQQATLEAFLAAAKRGASAALPAPP